MDSPNGLIKRRRSQARFRAQTDAAVSRAGYPVDVGLMAMSSPLQTYYDNYRLSHTAEGYGEFYNKLYETGFSTSRQIARK